MPRQAKRLNGGRREEPAVPLRSCYAPSASSALELFGTMAIREKENGVEVPYTRLAGDVLRRIAEEFVTRDGTDYGASEKTIEEKVSDVRRQLERGEAAIVYDAESETVNIVARRGRR